MALETITEFLNKNMLLLKIDNIFLQNKNKWSEKFKIYFQFMNSVKQLTSLPMF